MMKKVSSIIAAVIASIIVVSLSMTSVFAEDSERSGMISNPVISRGAPAYSGNGQASFGNDEHYFTFWESQSPDYLAYDLSVVPEEQRKQVIAVWYNISSYDMMGSYASENRKPIDYVIEVNAADGGEFPESGWETAETVTDNTCSSRQHIVNMEGYNWIRIRVTKSVGDGISVNFDIHNASEGVWDSWIFFGDSITAGGMNNCYGTGYATYINQLDSKYFPVQENGGIGGIRSIDGKENIDRWLSVSPARYVSIAYGTNDCWGNPDASEEYYNNTKYMIDAVLAAGKIPVLPKIPASTNSDVKPNVPIYNAKIDQLYEEYGSSLVQGPDFQAFFEENPDFLSDDGVHPNSEGYDAMRQLWAETMYADVYTKAQKTVVGDVNADNVFSIADIIMMQKWIVKADNLINWESGDMNGDNIINVCDLLAMKLKFLNKN